MDPHYAGMILNASEKTECLFTKEKCFQSYAYYNKIYGKIKAFSQISFLLHYCQWNRAYRLKRKSQTTGNNAESVLEISQQLFSSQASESVERIIGHSMIIILIIFCFQN